MGLNRILSPLPTPAEIGAISTTEKGAASGVGTLDPNALQPPAEQRAILVGTLAARPAAAGLNRWYYATDQDRLYREEAATWQEILSRDTIGARVFRSTAQSFANNTTTAVDFDSETFDPHGMWVVGTPTRLTVPADYPGYWIVLGGLRFLGAGGGQTRNAGIRKNGSSIADLPKYTTNAAWSATASIGLNPVALADAVAGDYFELYGQQDSGAALNTSSGSANIWMAAVFVGAAP